jgi:hypothetical protein
MVTGPFWREICLFFVFVGLYVAPIQYRTYGDFPGLLVEEDLRNIVSDSTV